MLRNLTPTIRKRLYPLDCLESVAETALQRAIAVLEYSMRQILCVTESTVAKYIC